MITQVLRGWWLMFGCVSLHNRMKCLTTWLYCLSHLLFENWEGMKLNGMIDYYENRYFYQNTFEHYGQIVEEFISLHGPRKEGTFVYFGCFLWKLRNTDTAWTLWYEMFVTAKTLISVTKIYPTFNNTTH